MQLLPFSRVSIEDRILCLFPAAPISLSTIGKESRDRPTFHLLRLEQQRNPTYLSFIPFLGERMEKYSACLSGCGNTNVFAWLGKGGGDHCCMKLPAKAMS